MTVERKTRAVASVLLSNSRQKDAFLYGSAFSRATLVTGCNAPLLEVSGTAAIDEHGQSLFPGDVAKQISHTLDSVEALLTSCGARLEDICAATAFVKRPRDAVRFWEIAAHRRLESVPVVCVVADLCRDELLFELDAEVVPS